MENRNLYLETDYIECSDEPFLFPDDAMSEDELNASFDDLMSEFLSFSL